MREEVREHRGLSTANKTLKCIPIKRQQVPDALDENGNSAVL